MLDPIDWLDGVTVAHEILILVTWVRLPVRPYFCFFLICLAKFILQLHFFGLVVRVRE
ncbi:hypothetical protein BDZ91DRAFT_751221 [Kalaharituber pfeilii]|nr:hypothetical protein BDZ91DRAFT_751221 [Kalaharituber pfeilii]